MKKPGAVLYLSPNLESVYRHCIQQIHESGSFDTPDLRRLLLPRQREISRFREQLSSVINVALYEFLGLTRDILREANSPLTALESFTIRRIVYDILSEMSENGQLTSFLSVWDKPGFVSMIIQWLREMKSQQIWVADYQRYADETNLERDRQLSLLYQKYNEVLELNGLADREGMQHAACKALEANPGLFAAGDSFFILGFDQFNPLQLTLIQSVASRKRNTCFYLVWDPDRDPDNLALNRFRRTREQLAQAFILDEVTIGDLAAGIAPALNYLKKSLFVNPDTIRPILETDAIRFVAAPSREEEVRYALRNIKQLLLDGVPPGEIVLLSPHPDRYIPLVRAISREYRIRLDITERLANNPVIVAFLNCLSLYPDFEWSMTLEVLRSPYVKQGWLTSDQVEILDRCSRLHPVVSGREQWLFALRADAEKPGIPKDQNLPEDEKVDCEPGGDLQAIEEGLTKFFDHLTPVEPGTARMYRDWVHGNILGDYPDIEEDEPVITHSESLNLYQGVVQGLFQERDITALDTLERILANISIAGRLISEHHSREITWSEFYSELTGMIDSTSLPGNQIYDRVLFDTLEAGRGRTVKYLIVIGLGEGEFPSPLSADPLYSHQERSTHPLPMRIENPADDASLWWQIINNCTGQLTLVRPYLDDNGADWAPSAYWDEVMSKFEETKEYRIPIGKVSDVQEAASLSELMASLAVNHAKIVPAELSDRWHRALNARDIQLARLSQDITAPYEGFLEDPKILSDLGSQFDQNHIWSPSRLNSYNNCPYGFYIQSILNIGSLADPGEGIDPLQRGILLHVILERYINRLIANRISPSPSNLSECLTYLEDACKWVLKDAPLKYGFLPGTLWQYEQQEIRRLLSQVVEWECDANGEPPRYTPYRTETRFGFDDSTLPPVVIEFDPHAILVHGVIDRIDRDQNGNLKVIDYKSGSTKINKTEISKGTALQTALYAIAAEGFAAEGERVQESIYLHLPSQESGGKLTFSTSVQENPDVDAAVNAVRFAVARIRNGEFPAVPANAGRGAAACRDRCDFAGLCRVNWQGIKKARQRGF